MGRQIDGISWTHYTFNPWWGCTKVSPACDSCYAEAFSVRIGFSEAGSKFPIWGKDERRRFFGDKHWTEPELWNRKAEREGTRFRVFCGSMCDVMEDRPDLAEPRRRLFALIQKTPHLDWLLLTKRPQNLRRFLPEAWTDWASAPEPNVWLMTTVESPEYLWRIQELLKVPAVIHGLSIEPLLGPLDLEYPEQIYPDGPPRCCSGLPNDCACGGLPVEPPLIYDIDWCITGSESGAHARPSDLQWFRSIRDQCKRVKTAFHQKQICERGKPLPMSEWPEDLRVQEFPEARNA